MNISGALINIPKTESAQAVGEALNERDVISVPTEFIVRMLELIQEIKKFKFYSELYSQQVGGAMEQRNVPPQANIFLVRRIDNIIKLIANTNC